VVHSRPSGSGCELGGDPQQLGVWRYGAAGNGGTLATNGGGSTPSCGDVDDISSGEEGKEVRLSKMSTASAEVDDFSGGGWAEPGEPGVAKIQFLAPLDQPRAGFTEEDLPQLRDKWLQACRESFESQPDELPPLREINHSIPLIDEKRQYHHRRPKCPDAFKPALMAKIDRYTKAGWWIPTTASRATPMLCIPKSSKNQNELRTVFDLREQNANTVKDVTPMPDQDAIRHAVARARHRSKCDISNAYELIRVEPTDVWKTAFATIAGTFASNVMQQGDCNAPSTFQRFMTHLFRDFLGKFLAVYLDDVFIYSDSIKEHEEHIGLVVDRLRDAQMVLNPRKCDFFSKRMDCLGHIIDDKGIHADESKMAQIADWRTPRSYHDVQRFLGLIQYLQHFMPNVSAFTGPLSSMTKNGHDFMWRPIHDKCFAEIKALAIKSPILKPIDPTRTEPIWVVCDASTSGVGAFYGQGKNWENCRPAGFMSRKFREAQHNYRVFEMETLAILEALLKWEDKLIGRRFTVITDHKALEFFSKQKHLSGRQSRWAEYFSRFNFDVVYVKGTHNVVADCLSRYYASDTPVENHPEYQYVSADIRLDPAGDDLPRGLMPELRAARTVAAKLVPVYRSPHPKGKVLEVMELGDALGQEGVSLPLVMSNTAELMGSIRAGYNGDRVFSKVQASPDHFQQFVVNDGLIYRRLDESLSVLCIPDALHGQRRISEQILDQAHRIIGHAGEERTVKYIRKFYWWPMLAKEVSAFCRTCGTCQAVKPLTQRPAGLLHSLPVPTRPWESIGMDFIGPLPLTPEGFNFIWVIIDRFTSMVHLVATRNTVTSAQLADLYLREIVRLHGVAGSIVSDRDPRFTAAFWREVNRMLGTKLLMSTSFHPQTDGVTERANRSINAVLRALIHPDQSDWAEKLPMVEFALNSSVSKSTGFAPFELNYGYLPTLQRLQEMAPSAFKPGVRYYADRARVALMEAHDAIIASRIAQTYHANKRRGRDPPYAVGDKVWLSTENLSMPKNRVRKLMPKFIGPFTVLRADTEKSNYKLDLPLEMRSRRISSTFHADRLRPFEANDEALFPGREAKYLYDYGTPEDEEWFVDAIIGHTWKGRKIEFNIQWSLGDTTWEPYEHCKDLAALDDYLRLYGVTDWRALPRRRRISPGGKAR